jgi:hypothetical protein
MAASAVGPALVEHEVTRCPPEAYLERNPSRPDASNSDNASNTACLSVRSLSAVIGR